MEYDYLQLGPEVHAASFVLKLGGQCRLHGSNKWLKLESNSLNDVIPQQRTSNFYVEALDLSRTIINLNGLSNFG